MLQNTTDLPELESQLNLTGEGVTLDELLNITTLDSVTTPVPDHACDNREYEIVSGIAAAVCITFGILYTFFGYRFFKAIMFLTGFLFCAVTVYMILSEVNVLPLEGVLGCAAGAGVLVGLVAMLIQYIGLFLTGFCLGLSAAAIILVVVEQFTHPYNMWIPIVVYLILGIATGLLGLRFQKAVIILSTSVIGGALALAGIDYFVGLLSMTFYLWDRVIARPSEQVCWFSWLILGLWPVVALAGAIVQWKFTGHEIDHRIVLRREQTSNVQTSRAREKRETQQTRYRHLYQARRVKGDVISQTFLQSIESKLSPAMQSLTALNTEPSNEEESTATTTLTHLT
ncbi:transmembrane protein 198 [Biomphalaria glabrata]|uniref:Transmembrane protein 198 n=1 Tax=Biomphalaria glabrata TaxID=6526 RepID=A0A9W2ZYC5_BIOGL|nr:transmembrane protein 198-like [Biomphalaria glabrata]XP_055879929.1 transmembrane protein 198-like [Biomphalaria glabrata]KAI8755706.1 transmembrane protein 198-like [Biomphalaria glabrata]KAI8793234.1 transmembrane protein 198 [Biomphalaria glabrata]